MLDHEVVHIGPDAADGNGQSSVNRNSANDKLAAKPSYKALVSLKSQILNAQGEKFKLMPGMQVVAEIDQGTRSVMEYLLSPVQKTLYESGHER